mgnify:FL=1
MFSIAGQKKAAIHTNQRKSPPNKGENIMTKKQQKIKSNQKSKRQAVWMRAAQRLANMIESHALSGEITSERKLFLRLWEIGTLIPNEARQEVIAQVQTVWDYLERIEATDGHAKSLHG